MTDDFEIHIIELPKIRERKANGKDKKLLEWLSFLENPESKEVTGYMEKNENMKQARERLNTLSADEEMRILAELREKAILDERSLKEGYYNDGIKVGKDELKQGDLLIFLNDSKSRIGHVGIYIGNNKFIHASNPSDGVKITSLSDSYYVRNYIQARRIIK